MLGWRRSDFAEFVNHNTKIYRGAEYIKAKKTQKKKIVVSQVLEKVKKEVRHLLVESLKIFTQNKIYLIKKSF